jgi:acyl dehydratase
VDVQELAGYIDAFLREEQVVVSQPHSRLIQLYLEDLHIGQRFTSGTYCMDAARIKSFAAEFDPQPFHLDEVASSSNDL